MTVTVKPPPRSKRDGNSKAVSISISWQTKEKANGPRKHDMRIGQIPKHVDATKIGDNRTYVKYMTPAEIWEECEKRYAKRGMQRSLKSDTKIQMTGIVTFGIEAQDMFNALTREQQDDAMLDILSAIEAEFQSTITGAILHLDETAPHLHFQMPGLDLDGYPLRKATQRGRTSRLQTIAHEVLQKHMPELERGHRKADRAAAGADPVELRKKSVRELHKTLKPELEATREKLEKAKKDLGQLEAKRDRTQRTVERILDDAGQMAERIEPSMNEKASDTQIVRLRKRLDRQNRKIGNATAEIEGLTREVDRLNTLRKNLLEQMAGERLVRDDLKTEIRDLECDRKDAAYELETAQSELESVTDKMRQRNERLSAINIEIEQKEAKSDELDEKCRKNARLLTKATEELATKNEDTQKIEKRAQSYERRLNAAKDSKAEIDGEIAALRAEKVRITEEIADARSNLAADRGALDLEIKNHQAEMRKERKAAREATLEAEAAKNNASVAQERIDEMEREVAEELAKAGKKTTAAERLANVLHDAGMLALEYPDQTIDEIPTEDLPSSRIKDAYKEEGAKELIDNFQERIRSLRRKIDKKAEEADAKAEHIKKLQQETFAVMKAVTAIHTAGKEGRITTPWSNNHESKLNDTEREQIQKAISDAEAGLEDQWNMLFNSWSHRNEQEAHLAERLASVARREQTAKTTDTDLKGRKEAVEESEAALTERETNVDKREWLVKQRETNLIRRENNVERAEKDLGEDLAAMRDFEEAVNLTFGPTPVDPPKPGYVEGLIAKVRKRPKTKFLGGIWDKTHQVAENITTIMQNFAVMYGPNGTGVDRSNTHQWIENNQHRQEYSFLGQITETVRGFWTAKRDATEAIARANKVVKDHIPEPQYDIPSPKPPSKPKGPKGGGTPPSMPGMGM